jgi:hypothetical protein
LRRARRAVAAVAAFAVLVPLWASRTGVNAGEGNVKLDGWYLFYPIPARTWPWLGVAAVSIAFVAAAMALWVARDVRMAAAGGAVLAAAVAGLVGLLSVGPSLPGAPVATSAYRAITVGMTRTSVRGRLGSPESRGQTTSASVPADDVPVTMSCLMYPAVATHDTYAFCFTGGRLTRKFAL